MSTNDQRRYRITLLDRHSYKDGYWRSRIDYWIRLQERKKQLAGIAGQQISHDGRSAGFTERAEQHKDQAGPNREQA